MARERPLLRERASARRGSGGIAGVSTARERRERGVSTARERRSGCVRGACARHGSGVNAA